MRFKIDLLSQLQKDVLGLIKEYFATLMLLEAVTQSEFVPLQEVRVHDSTDSKIFFRRNPWYRVFSKSFSAWFSEITDKKLMLVSAAPWVQKHCKKCGQKDDWHAMKSLPVSLEKKTTTLSNNAN